MVAIFKFAGSLSCGFLLCVGLSNTALAEHVPSASDVMKTDSATDRQGFQDDTELRIRTDKTTVMGGGIKKGELIEAKINDQNHALSIRSTKRK